MSNLRIHHTPHTISPATSSNALSLRAWMVGDQRSANRCADAPGAQEGKNFNQGKYSIQKVPGSLYVSIALTAIRAREKYSLSIS